MERFEGLNLPQLLDLMHGLVVPEPVPLLPVTSGWWIVAAWALAVVLLALGQVVRHRRRNRYRREAITALDTIAAGAHENPSAAAAEIAALVKRTALAAYPRERVANLYGREWADFLRATSGNDPVVSEAANRLAESPYRPDASGEHLAAPARRWIRLHRA
jgi:hypothetical protein